MSNASSTQLGNGESLRLEDLICRTCNVEATLAIDRVCDLCRSIGMSYDDAATPESVWSDIRFGGVCAKRFFFGLRA